MSWRQQENNALTRAGWVLEGGAGRRSRVRTPPLSLDDWENAVLVFQSDKLYDGPILYYV